MLSIANPTYNVADLPFIPKVGNTFTLTYNKTVINSEYTDAYLSADGNSINSNDILGAVYANNMVHMVIYQYNPAGYKSLNICAIQPDGSLIRTQHVSSTANYSGGRKFEGKGRWFIQPLPTTMTSLSSFVLNHLEDDGSVTQRSCSVSWSGTHPFASGTISEVRVGRVAISADGLTLIADVTCNLTISGATYYGVGFARIWKRLSTESSSFTLVVDRPQLNYMSEMETQAGSVTYGPRRYLVNMSLDGSEFAVEYTYQFGGSDKYNRIYQSGATYYVAASTVIYPETSRVMAAITPLPLNIFDFPWAHPAYFRGYAYSPSTPYNIFYYNYKPVTFDSDSRLPNILFEVIKPYSYRAVGEYFRHVLPIDIGELIVRRSSPEGHTLLARYSIRDLLPPNHPAILAGNAGIGVSMSVGSFVDGANKILLLFSYRNPSDPYATISIVEFDYTVPPIV